MNLEELITFHKACDKAAHTPAMMKSHLDAIELLTTVLPPKSADIESLPGKPWNAHAVLHDVLNEIAIDAPIVVLWLGKDEFVRHRAACTNMESVWMMHQQLHKY